MDSITKVVITVDTMRCCRKLMRKTPFHPIARTREKAVLMMSTFSLQKVTVTLKYLNNKLNNSGKARHSFPAKHSFRNNPKCTGIRNPRQDGNIVVNHL